MQKLSPLVLAVGAISFAAVPVQFTAGTSAKADDVNRNFAYLDSVKAAKSSVELLTSAMVAKIDAADVNAKLGTKVDTAAYGKFVRDQASKTVTDTALTRRVTSAEGAIANKVDKGSITTVSIHAIADTNGVSQGPLVVKGLLSATGGINSGNFAYSGRILSLATENTTNAPEIAWASKNGIGGTLGYDPSANGWYFYSATTKSQIMKIPAAAGGAFAFGAPVAANGNINASGDIQTNSVTRIDGNGNGFFSTVQAGSAPVACGKSAMTVQAAGDNWEQGIEILPSPDGAANKNSGWGGLFLRSTAGSRAGSWAILRSPTSEFNIMLEGLGSRVPMEGTLNPDAPLSIDLYGNTYLGGSLSVRRKILASNAEITDLRVAGSLKTSPTEPWADYVFEPGYKAMALKDVETFAKANGHLPDVPSAAEVAKDGIDLAKMNAILLKKIEELTLHAVAQEKKMEALSAKVEALQTERK